MQRLDHILEAASETLLPHIGFGQVLVMQQL
jgi:hypothetical protein